MSSPRARSVLRRRWAGSSRAWPNGRTPASTSTAPGTSARDATRPGDRAGCSGYATLRPGELQRRRGRPRAVAHLRGAPPPCSTWGAPPGSSSRSLRELGLDAEGCDVSRYAVDHAAPGARGHVRVGDLLAGLPWEDADLRPGERARRRSSTSRPSRSPPPSPSCARVCAGFVYATIPSFGANGGGGPDGIFEGKVRPERLAALPGHGPRVRGARCPSPTWPATPPASPSRAISPSPSYRWWTARFAEAGFTRRADVERRIYADIEPAGLAMAWNVYVFAVPGANERARRAPVAGVLVGGAGPAAPAVRHLTGPVRAGSDRHRSVTRRRPMVARCDWWTTRISSTCASTGAPTAWWS